MNGNQWLERATEKIEFEPDREAVRLELADHLQDRQERYAARGLPTEEAEAAALADMGEPAEIAEELGKLHRPFWGYLWTLSKILLGFAFILTIIAVFSGWGGNWFATQSKVVHIYERDYDFTSISEQRFPGSVRAGNYTVSASAILMEPAEAGERLLCLSIRFVPHIPWEAVDLYQLRESLLVSALTDDSGRKYSKKNGLIGNTRIIQSGIFHYLEFYIRLEDGKLPEWVDVPLGKSDYTLRLDFEEGVSLQ